MNIAPAPEGFSTPNLCRLSGCTYRQADYWARTGLLVPSVMDANGSGTQRLYSASDVHVAAALAAVSNAGFAHNHQRTDQARETVRAVIAQVRAHGLTGVVWSENGLIAIDLDVIPDPFCDEMAELVAARA